MTKAENLWNKIEEERYEYRRMVRVTDIIKYCNPGNSDLEKALLYSWFEHEYSHGSIFTHTIIGKSQYKNVFQYEHHLNGFVCIE